jgi:hypothetical protein
MIPAEIEAFWEWFVANERFLRQAYDGGDVDGLDNLLSPRMRQVAKGLGWEMGPYSLPNHTLVLSPGSRELAALCRTLIGLAPKVDGWRFLAGKPAKDLISICFEIAGLQVCADGWFYRLTSYNKGEFVDIDLLYQASDAPPLGKEAVFCELVIEALVGEMTALERVGYVNHRLVVDLEAEEKATPLRYLKAHLDEVLSPIH